MFTNLIKDLIEKKAKQAIQDKIGISPDILSKIDTDMIGSLIGWLTKNAKSGDAENIVTALEKDHDGGLLDNMGDIMDLVKNPSSWGILKHILWDKQATIESYIAKKYNLNPTMVSSAMKVIAPLVMAQLWKVQKDSQMNGSQLTDFLKWEETALLKDPSNNTNPMIAFLDKDGDGDVDAADLMAHAMGS